MKKENPLYLLTALEWQIMFIAAKFLASWPVGKADKT